VVLLEAEPIAGENPDLFGALARAYRRAGDDRRALDYYRRAKALAPADSDLVDGFEATVQAYGHSIEVEGFGEGGVSDARSISLAAAVRVVPRLRIEGSARAQRRNGSSEALGGGGALWRIARSTSLGVRIVGGSGNTSLPNADLTAAVVNYAGAFEVGGSIRQLSFADVGVIAASPLLAWDTGARWRLDARYTYSRSSFDSTGESSGDHSVLLRETWRAWRRVGVNVAYAYGIESFEDLTADRLQALGATTIAAGLRIRVPSLTSVAGTWEHQWRSNDTKIDRLTLSIVQSFP
jgi:YaiO family outer membrane protein